MNTLRGRLLAAFAYVLVLVLVALAVPFAVSVSSRVEAEVEGQAASEAHLIAASVAGRLDRPDALRDAVARAAQDVRGRVIVVDANGRLLADSEGGELLGTSYRARPEIAGVLVEGRTEQGKRRSETLDEELLYTAVPVVSEGQRVGAVRVTRSVAPIAERVRRDVLVLVGIAAAALALGLALAWLLAGSLARPLRALAATARRLEGGDLSARAEVAGSAEHKDVATAFNDMAARLERVLDAQREFVANASHQLRTPLTGLRLRLDAAAAQAGNAELETDLAAAEREVDRLAKLLTALLALARDGAEPTAAQAIDLGAAARSACARWQVEAEAGGRALACDDGEDAWVAASEEDVAIVLDNLVENALVYSPPGTAVTLSWGTRDGEAFVAVLDEGPGLAADEAERVFERFARGSASRNGAPGTGLGLAIVRTLARRWGGEARLVARPEGGVRAQVVWPKAADGRAASAAREVSVA